MKTDTGVREPVLILAIETSCDETSVAVVKDGCEVLSNIISSQIETHRAFGGVVPEVASRKHVEVITLVIEEALSVAGVGPQELTAVAVTQGPGLVGALLVGVVAAKAWRWPGASRSSARIILPVISMPTGWSRNSSILT